MARNNELQGTYIEPMDGPGAGSKLLVLFLSIVVGFIAAGLLIAYPQFIDFVWEDLSARVNRLNDEQRSLVPFAVGMGAVALLFLLRGFFLSSRFFGLLIGAFLWIPFGNHVLAAAPQVDRAMPNLRPGLNQLVTGSERLARIRGWAERTFPVPVPGAPEGDGDGGDAAPQTTENQG